MSFLLGSNADFLFPVASSVSVSSVSVLTVQDVSPAVVQSGNREPFVNLAGTSLVVEVPTADTNLFYSRLVSVTQKLDNDTGVVDDNYQNLVAIPSRSLSDSFHILLQKLDDDIGVTDDDYHSSLSYSSSGYFTIQFNALMDKLDSDSHVGDSDYASLKISENQTITVNFNQNLLLASEVAAVVSHAVGSSGNLEVTSKNGFVVMKSVVSGSDAHIGIKNNNAPLGLTVRDVYGTDHQLIPVSADISVVMVSSNLAAVSVSLDRNHFSVNKPYFIVMNDGGSQQVERIDISRQTLGSVNFVAGI